MTADVSPSATGLGPPRPRDASADAAPGNLRWDRVVVAALIGAYIAVRVSILARFTVYLSTDSPSYGPATGHPYLRTLSFAGHAPRPWGVPLLYNVVRDEWARAATQWTVGTLAWSFLAYGLWLHVKSRTARVVGVVLLLVLALNASVYPWDYAILSEPLSIDLGLLAFGLFAVWLAKRWWWALAGMVIAAFWWTFTRQDILPIAGVFILAVGVASAYRKHWSQNQRFGTLGALAVLLGGILWATLIIPNINIGYASWGAHYRLSESTFLYRLRFIILPDWVERDAYYHQFGMPACPGLQQIADGHPWNMGQFNEDYGRCPDLRAWVIKHGETSGYRFAIEHPTHYIAKTISILPNMLRGAPGAYARPVTVLPRAIDNLYYPAAHVTLPAATAIAVVSIGLTIAFGGWRRRRWLVLSGLAMCVVAVGNAAAIQDYSVGDYVRFGVQEAILLRVGLIVLIATAIDAGAAWRRWPAVAESVRTTLSRGSARPSVPPLGRRSADRSGSAARATVGTARSPGVA